MINKKNLWFLTLFSLVLVLSVYYVTMPNELMVTNNGSNDDVLESENDIVVDVNESDIISALKVEDGNTTKEEISKVKEKLTNTDTTVEDKNSAFEELKVINQKVAKEEMIEEKLKSELKLETFVKIDGDQIRVVVGTTEHTASLANEIMRLVQSLFDSKMYISVQFQG